MTDSQALYCLCPGRDWALPTLVLSARCSVFTPSFLCIPPFFFVSVCPSIRTPCPFLTICCESYRVGPPHERLKRWLRVYFPTSWCVFRFDQYARWTLQVEPRGQGEEAGEGRKWCTRGWRRRGWRRRGWRRWWWEWKWEREWRPSRRWRQ